MELIKQLVWPAGFEGKIARLLGACSAIAIFRYGLNSGLGSAFQLLLEYYDRVVGLVLGWATPYIESGLARFGWNLSLYPQWKHILVLMCIYFLRNSLISYGAKDRGIGHFELVWGVTVALVASIAAGTIPLTSEDRIAQFLIAAIPVGGIWAYEIGDVAWRATFYRERAARIYHRPTPTWWAYFEGGLRGTTIRTLIGIVLLAVGLQVPAVQKLRVPGLVLLSSLVFIQALNFLRMGLHDAKRIRQPDESWRSAYWRTGVAKVGAAMLGVFLWVGVILISSAGLRFVGL